jgi:AcrR family transcriptional regulator
VSSTDSLTAAAPDTVTDPDTATAPGSTAGATPKAERTRTAIIDAALRLFREQGYDATTMRAVASEAGVSVGNAYYYFASKEHLIQAFYDRAGEQHRTSARAAIADLDGLGERLATSMAVWLDTMDPYRAFAGSFFKNAAEPTSPLSPFSTASGPARQAAVGFMAEIIDGSNASVSADIAAELPKLLWLYSMGVVLFWVHDTSAGAAKSHLLVRRTAPLIEQAVAVAQLPFLQAVLADLVSLVTELRSPD